MVYLDSQLVNNLFTLKDLEILNIFTTQVSLSLERALLHKQIQQKNTTQKQRKHLIPKLIKKIQYHSRRKRYY